MCLWVGKFVCQHLGSLVLTSIFLFYVYKYFAYMYISVPHICCTLGCQQRTHGSPGIGVRVDYGLSCGARKQTHGPLQGLQVPTLKCGATPPASAHWNFSDTSHTGTQALPSRLNCQPQILSLSL